MDPFLHFILYFTNIGWFSEKVDVLCLNLLVAKISESMWTEVDDRMVSMYIQKVATTIQPTLTPECSINTDSFGEQDSILIRFVTKVDSVEESFATFNSKKAQVETIVPNSVENRVDILMVRFIFLFIPSRVAENCYLPWTARKICPFFLGQYLLVP